ncbi:SMP-30/gluconolactonase/LRE family protein [Pirellulaceae bacterium SH449]
MYHYCCLRPIKITNNLVRLSALVSVLSLLGGFESRTLADDFDVYFLGGQSNMEGFGTNSHLSDDWKQPIEGALIFHSTALPDQVPALGLGKWEAVEPGHGTGFSTDGTSSRKSDRFGLELSFAREMRNRKPGRKIAIIKYARNGSSIAAPAAGPWGCWEPDFQAAEGDWRDINQYDHFLATVRNAMDVDDIDGDGIKDRLIPAGILWMQGESDATATEEIANNYGANLKRLMDLMRASLRVDDLPVVIGLISDSQKGQANRTWKYGDQLRAQQRRFAAEDAAAKVVIDTDLYAYSDPWHYDSMGYIDLGKQFANSILSIPRVETRRVFEPGSVLKIEADQGHGGEGPAWDADLGVLTSGNGNIQRLSPDGTKSVFLEGAGTNGLLFDKQGRLLCCEPKYRRVTRVDRDGTKTVLTDSYEGKPYNQPNDITVDSKGRIYFSDPRYGERDDMQQIDASGKTVEGVYLIDLDGSVHRIIGREVDRANGVLVTRDDKYLLVADNNNNSEQTTRALWRFDLRADGTVDLDSKTMLFDWGRGRGPDGLVEDSQGRFFVAAGLNHSNPPYEPDDTVRAGIYVMDICGQLLDFLAVPTDEVTNCTLGGSDSKTLYVTGGGVLYSVRLR